MNDDLRRVFETALSDSEPPVTAAGSELAARGRTRHRRRRVGFTVSVAALALAAVTGIALVQPGAAGGTDQRDSAGDGDSRSDDPYAEEVPQDTTELLTMQVQMAFEEVYTDAVKYDAPDEGEPFQLELFDESDPTSPAVGNATLPDSEYEQVRVSLYPPGEWTEEAGNVPPDSETFDTYIVNCWSGDVGGNELSADCDEKDLGEAGMLRTAVIEEKWEQGGVSTTYRTALFRPDGTAVVLDTNCGTGDLENRAPCERDDLLTADPDQAASFVERLPNVPEEWKD